MAAKLKGLTISVIPGTGSIGSKVAKQLGRSGLSVVVGSRDPAKANAVAAEISKHTKHPVKGLSNEEAAAVGDVIFWSPSGPIADRESLLKSLAKSLEGKVIIDTTNVVFFFDDNAWGQISSTLLNQKALGVPARWTTAFKNTFANLIENTPDPKNPHSTFVAGDDEEAVDITIALVESIPGFKGVKAGGLKNTKIVELLGRWAVDLDKLNSGTWRTGFRFGQ